jgi:hypothetical protein
MAVNLPHHVSIASGVALLCLAPPDTSQTLNFGCISLWLLLVGKARAMAIGKIGLNLEVQNNLNTLRNTYTLAVSRTYVN